MLHSFAKDAGVSGLQEAGLAGRLARGFGAPICLIALLSGCLPAKGPAPAPQAAPDTSAAAPARPDAETLKAADYPQDAADELEKLLALHPDEARGHLTLGNLYAQQLHDIPRARRHYNRVLQLDPRNPQAQSIRYWLVANPG